MSAKEQFATLVADIMRIEGFAHGDATAVAVRRNPALYEAYRLEQVAKSQGRARVDKAAPPLTYAQRLAQRAAPPTPVTKVDVPTVDERRQAHNRGEAPPVSAAAQWQAQVDVWKAHPDPADPLSYDAYRWKFATAKPGRQG